MRLAAHVRHTTELPDGILPELWDEIHISSAKRVSYISESFFARHGFNSSGTSFISSSFGFSDPQLFNSPKVIALQARHKKVYELRT